MKYLLWIGHLSYLKCSKLEIVQQALLKLHMSELFKFESPFSNTVLAYVQSSKIILLKEHNSCMNAITYFYHTHMSSNVV